MKNPAAVALGRLGGLAARGKSGRPRKYPKCTAKRHRFWKGVCSHCGLTQAVASR